MNLTEYIKECNTATPSNTIGAGNPALPGTEGEFGSGDTIKVEGPLKIKKIKSLKKYIKNKIKHHDKE